MENVNLYSEGCSCTDENGNNFVSSHITVFFKGKNNKILINKSVEFYEKSHLYIIIYGSNCTVTIGENNRFYYKSSIDIGCINNEPSNVKVNIGKNNGFSSVKFSTINSNTSLTIGNDCMFSDDITLLNTDNHPIYDLSSGKLINYVKDMIIGNEVWCCEGATILKNVSIPSGCIVARSAVVADKKLTKENCIIAGNPAKVVKENIKWSGFDKTYIDNNQDLIMKGAF